MSSANQRLPEPSTDSDRLASTQSDTQPPGATGPGLGVGRCSTARTGVMHTFSPSIAACPSMISEYSNTDWGGQTRPASGRSSSRIGEGVARHDFGERRQFHRNAHVGLHASQMRPGRRIGSTWSRSQAQFAARPSRATRRMCPTSSFPPAFLATRTTSTGHDSPSSLRKSRVPRATALTTEGSREPFGANVSRWAPR